MAHPLPSIIMYLYKGKAPQYNIFEVFLVELTRGKLIFLHFNRLWLSWCGEKDEEIYGIMFK
jgi:hypothetical protein